MAPRSEHQFLVAQTQGELLLSLLELFVRDRIEAISEVEGAFAVISGGIQSAVLSHSNEARWRYS